MDPITLQRRRLCDVLDSLTDEQWAAETLCEGWDAGDIAAHLLVREREPLAAVGIVWSPLSGLTRRRMAARKRRGRERLIAALRKGPPPWFRLPPLGRMEVVEEWIHTQDVRRGGAGLGPDEVPPEIAERLWPGVSVFGRVALAKAGVSGVVELTDGTRTRRFRVDGRTVTRADDEAELVVRGEVGELLLFVAGREKADVVIHGDRDLRDALTAADRGL